jgi:ribosomal protein L37E
MFHDIEEEEAYYGIPTTKFKCPAGYKYHWQPDKGWCHLCGYADVDIMKRYQAKKKKEENHHEDE